MCPATYLIFGDLHGHVLPAFKLAQAWAREHDVALAGLLQVGDLGVSHLELDSRTEEGSVGVLRWDGSAGDFAYLDPAWLRTVTRSNWKHR
jgi:hypothetical protein